VKGHPTVIGGEIVIKAALELLASENRFGVVHPIVIILCDLGALWIGNGVDVKVNFADELKEWF
jgi:hypothetical protein